MAAAARERPLAAAVTSLGADRSPGSVASDKVSDKHDTSMRPAGSGSVKSVPSGFTRTREAAEAEAPSRLDGPADAGRGGRPSSTA